MARTPFGSGSKDEFSGTPAAAPAGPGGLTAFIDQGSEFEGKLSFKDTVRIDGRFCGEISSENTLIVGESGEIEADIRSNVVAVSGSVKGDIIAGSKVILHKSCRVTGNIETQSLIVEEGAQLEGSIKMGKGMSSPSKPKPNGGSGAESGGNPN